MGILAKVETISTDPMAIVRLGNMAPVFTDRVRSTREGYVLTRICPSVCLSTGGTPLPAAKFSHFVASDTSIISK